MLYTLVLNSDDGQNYGVTVPDLPGCFSGGGNIEDAIESAKEAIPFHILGLLDSGMDVPEQKSFSVHVNNPEHTGAVFVIVDICLDDLG